MIRQGPKREAIGQQVKQSIPHFLIFLDKVVNYTLD
jgi:hypothetical protein